MRLRRSVFNSDQHHKVRYQLGVDLFVDHTQGLYVSVGKLVADRQEDLRPQGIQSRRGHDEILGGKQMNSPLTPRRRCVFCVFCGEVGSCIHQVQIVVSEMDFLLGDSMS